MTTNTFAVHAIPTDRLDRLYTTGADDHGNALRAFRAGGGEPLRCCLARAIRDESIALISYAPFRHVSPWTEVGPVFVHATPCAGPRDAGVPAALRVGPRVLRTYDAHDAMDYEHITVVDGDVEPELERLLAIPGVATVHVRTLAPQCFLFAVTAE